MRVFFVAFLVGSILGCGCKGSDSPPVIPIVPAEVPCALTLRWAGAAESVVVRIGSNDRIVARADAVPGVPFLVEVPPQGAGPFVVRMTGERSGDTQTARWFAFPDRRPVLVCDVDHTLYDGSGLTAIRDGGFNAARVLTGSPAALARLAERYAIVYLSARDERLRERTEAFLRDGGFPPGPLLLWTLEGDPVSRAALKSRRLRELRAVWPWLAWGIGDRDSDLRAYRSVGLDTVLIAPGTDLSHPAPDVWRVGDWGAVGRTIDEADSRAREMSAR